VSTRGRAYRGNKKRRGFASLSPPALDIAGAVSFGGIDLVSFEMVESY